MLPDPEQTELSISKLEQDIRRFAHIQHYTNSVVWVSIYV